MRKIKTLKKNYEFKNVLSKGKFYIGKQISIYILKNNKKINEFYSKTQQAPLAAPPCKVMAIDQPNQNVNQIMASRKGQEDCPFPT